LKSEKEEERKRKTKKKLAAEGIIA